MAAASVAADPSIAAGWIVEASKTHQKLGELVDARRVLVESARRRPEPAWRADLLVALADTHKSSEDEGIRAALLTRAAQISPTSSKIRFDAAYALSQASLAHLALMHYDVLLGMNSKHASALNNIAVQCNALEMPAKAVEYFRRSYNNGETLAAANLAERFINSGFLTDAEELISAARKQDNPHQNVGAAMSSLANKKETEEEQWRSVIDIAIKEQMFLSEFAEALLATTAPNAFLAPWETKAGKSVQFAATEDRLTVELGDKHDRLRVSLVRCEGRAATATSEKWEVYRDGYGGSRSGYAYLSEDGKELRWLWLDGDQPTFAVWRAKPALTSSQADTAQQPGAADGAPGLAGLGTGAPRLTG